MAHEFVWGKMKGILEERLESIMKIIKSRKLKYYGNQIQTMMILTEEKVEGSREECRPIKQREDDLID